MMGILKKAGTSIWKYKWEALALYVVHLISGLLVGAKMKKLMSAALGNSTIGKNLSVGYDSNTMADLIRHAGLDLSSIAKVMAISLPIALLMSAFLSGGVIANISTNQTGLKLVLSNGWKHLGKFLLTSLVTLVVIIIACCIVWVPFLAYSGDPIQTYDTEKPFILLLIGFLIVSVLLTFCAAAWSVKAKSLISLGVDHPFKSAFRWLLANLLSILGFTLLTLLMLVFWITVYILLISLCNGNSIAAWLSVILGQLMIYTICKLRIWYYGGLVKT